MDIPCISVSSFVCLVGNSRVDNRRGVLVGSCVDSAVSRCSWVVLTITRGRVGLVARVVGTCLFVVRGDCVDAVVGKGIIRGRVALGVWGGVWVVGFADGPLLRGEVVVGNFEVLIIFRIGPERRLRQNMNRTSKITFSDFGYE